MSTGRQYRSGALLSYLAIALNTLSGLFFTPVLTAAFDPNMMGVYGTITKFAGYIAVMDLGLGNAVIRYVSKYRAENDRVGMERFLGTVLALYTAIGVVVWIIGMVCFHNLPAFYPKYTAEEMALAQKLFMLVLVNMTFSMLLNIFPGALQAHERFAFINTVKVLRIPVRIVLLLLMVWRGTDPFQVLLLDTFLSVATALCFVCYSAFVLHLRVRKPNFERTLLRQIFSYSVFIFLNVIMDQIYWNVDIQLVSGLRGADPALITYLGGNLVNYFIEFSSALSSMFLPRAVQLVQQGADREALTDLLIRVGRLQLMVISLLVVGFGMVGKQFFTLWVGGEIGAEGVAACYAIVLMQMLALLVPMFENVAISITQAMNKHAFRSVMLAIVAVLNVVLSVFLIRIWGPVGAAVGTAVSLVIGNTAIANWYYHKKIGLNIPRFFRETLHGILPALLLVVALSCATFLMPQTSWLSLLARAGVIVALYVGVMIPLGMNGSERGLLRDTAGGILRRLHLSGR